jgi:type I restriction enzyme R subunit
MPKPGEHKTVQARILAYAQAIGWTYVPRAEAEKRRGFDHSKATPAEQAAEASPYFDDLLDAQVRKLNPKYAEGPGALVGNLRRLHADIAGNRDRPNRRDGWFDEPARRAGVRASPAASEPARRAG